MTVAEEPTAAADKLDAVLAEATSAPWLVRVASTGIRSSEPYAWVIAPAVGGMAIAERHNGGTVADMRYIAAMNPDVGRALAALLRWTSERWIDAKAVEHHSARQEFQGLALTIARAILAPTEVAR